MNLTLSQVKSNPHLNEYIRQTAHYLESLGYTDHGFRHVNIVADRAKSLAAKIGLSKRDQELAAIAGYCHDMGNFLGRTLHHYLAATLFSQHYIDANPKDVATIMQAIVTHDKQELKIVNKVTAVTILADKSDVHRTRVTVKVRNLKQMDIHDRVNYSVTDNQLLVSLKKKIISLKLNVDTKVTPVLEYFEIFTARMAFCRTAAEHLGYKFGLEINNFKLL